MGRSIAVLFCVGLCWGCESPRPKGPVTFTELGEWEAQRVGEACAWVLIGAKEPDGEWHRDTIWGDVPGFSEWRTWALDLREGDAGWAQWPGADRWEPHQGPAGMGGRWWIRVERVFPGDPLALAQRMVEGSIREQEWLEAAVRQHSRTFPELIWQREPQDPSWFATITQSDSSDTLRPGDGIWLDIRSASLERMEWPLSQQDTTSFPAIQWTFRWGDEGQTLPALRDFLQRRGIPGIYWWVAPASAARGEDGTPLAGHTPEMPGFYRIEVLRDSSLAPTAEHSSLPK